MARHTHIAAVLAVTLGVAMIPAQAHATIMVEVPLEDMAADSHGIVRAVVEDVGVVLQQTPWGAEANTVVRLRVDEWLKGSGGSHIEIFETGGDLGNGEGIMVVGTPTYRVGEEVIVFLERRFDGALRTYAMAQGKFSIRRGVPGTPSVVTRDMDGLAVAEWENGNMVIRHLDDGPIALTEVERRIREVVDYVQPGRPTVVTDTPGTTGGGI